MIDKATVFDNLWPGRTPGRVPDLRPLLRQSLHRRLRMFSMLLQVRPDRCEDPAALTALLERIESMPLLWQERFFDDVDVAAWIMSVGQVALRHADPVPIAPLAALITCRDNANEQAEQCDIRPRLLANDLPPNLSAAITQSLATDKPGIAVSRPTDAYKEQLQVNVTDGLNSLTALWPEMAASAQRYMAAVVVVDDRYSTSNIAFPGVVVLGDPNIREAIPEGGLCDHIVHETIHQMLYCLQEIHPLIRPGTSGTFESPWTRRHRPMAVAAHIPLVYLATLEYLVRLRKRAFHPRIADRMRRIVAGMDVFFSGGTGRAHLTAWGGALHQQVRSAYEQRRYAFLE